MQRRVQDVARGLARALRSNRGVSSTADVNPAEFLVANGVPAISPARQVLVYAEEGGPWKVHFENQNKWINPLMGWTSTGDALENVSRPMYFGSKEAAVAFAEKNGWNYTVEEPHLRSRARPRRYQGYGDNFSVKRKGLPQGGLRSEQSGKK